MKHLYKIGRLFLVSEKLPANYEPFLLPGTFCDEKACEFTDAAGVPVKKPFGIDPEKNVLFLNFISGTADLTSASCTADLDQVSIWKSADNTEWIYISKLSQSWMKLACDYSHASCFMPAAEFSPDEDPTQLIDFAVECRLIRMGYVIMHAACIEVKGKAVLFSAPSGTGKSTRADRWVEACGAKYISGDRPIIDTMLGTALGAPWDGKEGIHRNVEKPIEAINFIRRAEKTKFTRLTGAEGKKTIPAQTFIPLWDPALAMEVFAGIKRITRSIQVFALECDQTVEAAMECSGILFPGEPANTRELLVQLKALDVPTSNYKYYVDRHIENKARKLGIPRSGTFELTPLCNLDCKMCYVHMHKSDLAGKLIIDTERWKRIMRDAHDAGMAEATLTGGECLIYPGFEEIYLYLQSLGVQITVLTNGRLLNEMRAEFFKSHTVQEIQITLYGSNNDVYERVTGVRCFDQVYRNIKYAKELGLPISLAITPNLFSYEDSRSLLELVEKTQIPYRVNNILSKPRKDTKRELQDLTSEQYIEIYKIQAQLKSKYLQPVDISELPTPQSDGEDWNGLRCSAGNSAFCITWKGEMIPCTALPEISEDLGEHDFIRTWNLLHKKTTELLLPKACHGCAYVQVCNFCPADHFDSENPGACNYKICEHTRALIESGIKRF